MVTSWFPQDSGKKSHGVVLVVHGLNLNPIRMKGIVAVLNSIKLEVLLLSLKGHGENFDKTSGENEERARLNSFRRVTYGQWKSEIEGAYQQVIDKANELNCPRYFVGYSLGGLMGCNLMVSLKNHGFDKMILFAPAIATHRIRVPFFKLLYLFPGLVVPSLSPSNYRANRGTPIAGYLSLLEALHNYKSKMNDTLNIPTVIFIDKNDELVSYRKLVSQIKNHHLKQWTVHKIVRHPGQLKYPFHHLIIDESSAGKKDWSIIRSKMIAHLS